MWTVSGLVAGEPWQIQRLLQAFDSGMFGTDYRQFPVGQIKFDAIKETA